MIWLIGNRGLLGTEVELLLNTHRIPYVASDQEVDITDSREIRRFAEGKPLAWIINCAAYTAVDRAEDEQDIAFAVNAAAPRGVAEIARDGKAKMIHISTDYVFDGAADCSYTEDDVPNPLCVYSESKCQGERNVIETLPAHFIVRSAWLYGKGGGNFANTMLRLFQEKDEVSVVSDQWGSPTYAPDLAEAIIHIVRSGSTAYGIYHFTNEGRVNWYQFACAIYDLAREKGLVERQVSILPINTGEYPAKANRPRYAHLSKEKICRTFGIRLRPWREALDAYLSTIVPANVKTKDLTPSGRCRCEEH